MRWKFAKPRRFKIGAALLGIAALLVIAGLLGSAINRRRGGHIDLGTRITVDNLGIVLSAFKEHTGRFPSTAEGLAALLNCPSGVDAARWKGPYLSKNKVPTDAWRSPYIYQCPGGEGRDFDIISTGPDKILGTDDDITSFDKADGTRG